MPLLAGAAMADISPLAPLHLAGYPNVERISTDLHDPLLATALALDDGSTRLLIVSTDSLYVQKDAVGRVRTRIEALTGIPAAHILVAATHTHSGPLTVDRPYRQDSPTTPPPDPAYLRRLEDGIVESAVAAWRDRRAAEAAFGEADGSAVGGNRRDPAGPANPRMPILALREAHGGKPLALLTLCCMHPTVLHEDSTLVSADFPGAMRRFLREQAGFAAPVLYLSGPAGNQSPRHVARANTFEECDRLGGLLGQSVARALGRLSAHDPAIPLRVAGTIVELPRREFPEPVGAAAAKQAQARWESMKRAGLPTGKVRTAECDWFGAARLAWLARFAANGGMDEATARLMPAEIQVLGIGPLTLVAWPGEMFVEFGLEVMAFHPGAHVVAYANGEVDGYLVTAEAAAEGGYEAAGALFKSPESGRLLVARTLDLLRREGGAR